MNINGDEYTIVFENQSTDILHDVSKIILYLIALSSENKYISINV